MKLTGLIKYINILFLVIIALSSGAAPGAISWWLTTGNQSALLQKQNGQLAFGNAENQFPIINIDSSKTYQEVDGFGFALTGSSAFVINQMPPNARNALLLELFGHGKESIGISYIRVSIGSSDLSPSLYSYDDMAAGQTDEALDHFSLGTDQTLLLPLLQQILKINPNIKILGSPWSAPVWMKDNNSTTAGTLQPKYYQAYANYFVKYLQSMSSNGIPIDAITVQNEPLCITNNPSMGLSAGQELNFVKNYLGPTFKKEGIKTKIIIWDHNCDNPQYPITILTDPGAKEYINGSAFHLYTGDISALTQVHKAFPDKNIYFTEQYTAVNGDFGGDLKWHLKNLVTGAMRNWSRNVIEWNLASDGSYGPHTQGGCSTCKGALTINAAGVKRNVSYYIIGHASKFVPAGSVRIWSNISGNLNTVAFLTPGGNKVLIVENDGSQSQSFNIKYNGEWAVASLDGGSVATYTW